MKKKLCALILAMACVCSLGTTGASAAGMQSFPRFNIDNGLPVYIMNG